jgi:phosphoribosylformylglycinamidine synthase subunit PurSL
MECITVEILEEDHMVNKIFIYSIVPDSRSNVFIQKLRDLGCNFSEISVNIIDVYSVQKKLINQQINKCGEMLTNPVVQKYSINKINSSISFDWAIEIGFLPGVTDNVGNTAKEIFADGLHLTFSQSDSVYFSRIYCLSGKFTRKVIKCIADSLYNPIIERVIITNKHSFTKKIINSDNIPEVKLQTKVKVNVVNLNICDDELTLIGTLGIVNSDRTRRGPLSLNLESMKSIQKYFRGINRNPTDVELESIAQTWSEHCKHTIFANPLDEIKSGLFNTYIKRATEEIRNKLGKNDFCASVFTDNSGAIIFDRKYLVTHKVETHNSPSALDPYGGAVTGIGGVNRDAIGFGLGSKPIVNTFGFCFSNPKDKKLLFRGKNQTQPMLSPRRILNGVVAGVNSGGNCSGIPTPQGFVYFDQSYKGKPLVFVGTVGLIPRKINGCSMINKKARSGDYIVMAGGRVGLDGIHGATFSSEALTSGSPSSAVQIGDPITQKKLSDVLVKETRNLGLYTSITDNGAGGLSCSVAEMAKESNGCDVDLDKVPLKYPGLSPWQIWISESQERMTLSVPPKKWLTLYKLLKKRGVEATVIGKFTKSGRCIVNYQKSTVMDIEMNFLHNGLPRKLLSSTYTKIINAEPDLPNDNNYSGMLEMMLTRQNVAGYEYISRQYDHEVQGSSVLKPLQGIGRVNADTTVVRPLLDSITGIVLSQSLYPTYSAIDTYQMAACTIDTAVRNVVSVGADPSQIALLDNFCWCSSKDPERLGQLKAAVKACFDIGKAYLTPFISGKDSMFNDFSGFDEYGKDLKISILPTLLISAIGIIKDIQKAVSLDFKIPGDLIYIIGDTQNEMGASEYYALLGDKSGKYLSGNRIPVVNTAKNWKIYKSISRCINQNLISSAIGIGRGGMGVSVAKSAIAGRLGFEINLQKLPGKVSRNDQALFSESQGRILVSINPSNQMKFEKIISGTNFALLGKVTQTSEIKVRGLSGKIIVATNMDKLSKKYKSTFSDY